MPEPVLTSTGFRNSVKLSWEGSLGPRREETLWRHLPGRGTIDEAGHVEGPWRHLAGRGPVNRNGEAVEPGSQLPGRGPVNRIGEAVELSGSLPRKASEDKLEDGTWHHYPGRDQLGGTGHESDTWRNSPGRGKMGRANQDEGPWRQPRRDPLNVALPGYADMEQGSLGGNGGNGGAVGYTVDLEGRDDWESRLSAGRHSMGEVAQHLGDVRNRLRIRGDTGKRPGDVDDKMGWDSWIMEHSSTGSVRWCLGTWIA